MLRSRRLAALCAAGLLAATPALADGDRGPDVSPTWETSVDGEQRNDDVARLATASWTTNNSVETVFVTGLSLKGNVLEATGIDDYDTLTTAFDATTGAVRWNDRFDSALGVDDVPVGIEVNYNNNVVYVVSEADGAILTRTLAVTDGTESDRDEYQGIDVADTAISVSGSWLFVAGRSDGGAFHVLGYETGPDTLTIDDRPVAGEALAVDAYNTYGPGDIDSWRTVIATGTTATGDAYTAAYRIDDDARTWSHTVDRTDADAGTALDMSYVRGDGGVAFVAGTSTSPAGDTDQWLQSLDADTGAVRWTADHAGPEGGDEIPVAVHHNDTSGIVYVTGTTDRGVPHGRDILTLAYDAATGELLGQAYSDGGATNGPDAPTSITSTPDGQRVFVSAHVYTQDRPNHRAGVLAFDAALHPAGLGLLSAGGDGLDRARSAHVSLDGTRVLVGGGHDTANLRLDHAAAAFAIDAFEPVIPDPVATTLELTGPPAALAEDAVTLTITLADETGTPLADRDVTLTVDAAETWAATDSDGTVTHTFTAGDPDTVSVTASFAGGDDHLPSAASTTVEVSPRPTTIAAVSEGRGAHRTITATLTDDRGPLAGRTLTLEVEGTPEATAVTDAAGTAVFGPHPGRPKGARTVTFAGEARYERSTASV